MIVKKILLIFTLILLCIGIMSNDVFSSTGYVPSDEEIAPVSDIKTGDKALSDINVRIFQPFFDEMDNTPSTDIDLPAGIISDAQCPVAPVKTLQEYYGALIKTTRTINQPISLEDIKSLGPNQIIIFSGHGTWIDETTHSTIVTGKLFDYDDLDNPLYKQDVEEGRIVNDVGNEAITYKYIEKYCPNLNNSFVFLGICQGAYHCDGDDGDLTLVNTFLNKGAKAVFAYTQTTDMRYSNVMVYTIIDDLAKGMTLGQALEDGKTKYGPTCPSAAHSTPMIFPEASAANFSINSIFNNDAPLKQDYVFDGKEKAGVMSGVGYTLTGTSKASNVGDYIAEATLLPGFKWPDGSIDPKVINWSITEASVNEADLIPNNIETKYDSNEHDLLVLRYPNLGKYYYRIQGETDYSENIPKASNVDEYSIEWYFEGNGNANDVGSSSSPIIYSSKIVKGIRPNMEARINDYYYGKELPSPYLTKDVEEGTTIEYYYFKEGDLYNNYKWENMTSTTLEPGNYYIYAKIEETDNYEYFVSFDSRFRVLEYIPSKKHSMPKTGIEK